MTVQPILVKIMQLVWIKLEVMTAYVPQNSSGRTVQVSLCSCVLGGHHFIFNQNWWLRAGGQSYVYFWIFGNNAEAKSLNLTIRGILFKLVKAPASLEEM